ncbi:MAG: helix-turn-helix domain-containing protein [Thermoguttaceae bacterium]|nr:helix-turn-helix domain-containing protein [Thermoguttaceae bacterium]
MTLIKYRDGALRARFSRPMNTRPLRPAETLNLAEAAAFLGVSTKWLRAQVESGSVPGRRLGRKYLFSRAALNSWIASSASGD